MMQTVPIVQSGRTLYLRPTVPNDAQLLFDQGFSQRAFMRLFRLNSQPQSVGEVHQQLVHRQQIPPQQRTYIELLIVHRRYGPIGLCAFADYSAFNGRAEYLIGLFHSTHRSIGYGIEATLMAMDLAFNTYGLHKLYASTYGYNHPPQMILAKADFHLDGIQRDHVFDPGCQQFVDLRVYSMLVDEFRANSNLAKWSLRYVGRDITLVPSLPDPTEEERMARSGTRILQTV